MWHSTGEDSGYWCDHGWWEFNLEQHAARLSSDMSIKNDSKNPTASGSALKSGYGINQTVTGNEVLRIYGNLYNPAPLLLKCSCFPLLYYSRNAQLYLIWLAITYNNITNN